MKLEISEVEVQKLSVKPGDILVFRFSSCEMTSSQLKAFRESLRKIIPDKVKAVILFGDGKLDISTITPEVG